MTTFHTQTDRTRRRGQPLVVLGVVLGLWVVVRATLWQSPFPLPAAWTDLISRDKKGPNASSFEAVIDRRPAGTLHKLQHADSSLARSVLAESGARAGRDMRLTHRHPVEILAGHQLMWIAAMSKFPAARESAAMPDPAGNVVNSGAALPDLELPAVTGQNRWSFDGWVLYRPESGSPGFTGAMPTSYGGSQAGGVLSFSLAPADRHRPMIYVRGSRALVGAREAEAALGLSARPVPAIPVRALAEMRLQNVNGDNRLRPAVLAVTELVPVSLPLGTRGEAYAQAGYVGGRFATPFVDGQARITREVAQFELAQVDVGVGVWGGAQEGAARLDAGPTASVHTRFGEAPARLSVDYRERLAGDAVPGSGITVTFSVGF